LAKKQGRLAEKQGYPGNYLTLFFRVFPFYWIFIVASHCVSTINVDPTFPKKSYRKAYRRFFDLCRLGYDGFSMSYEMPSRNDAIGTTDGPALLHGCGYCTEAGRLCYCVHPWFSSAWMRIRGTLTP
jgi:hypothetical protein